MLACFCETPVSPTEQRIARLAFFLFQVYGSLPAPAYVGGSTRRDRYVNSILSVRIHVFKERVTSYPVWRTHEPRSHAL